ncbi:MAG: DNA mismatch repair protein MutS [Syntrophomonadaceae bacterium]
MTSNTPMIEQYLEIKKQHQDAILFFRLGDFYEMFFDDAEIAAQVLEIVLTSRESGKGKVPMCGVPYHSAGNYIARLINRGFKIAICEQVEDPKMAKGIVRREVTRIITPGTVLEEFLLEENRNNYLAAIGEEKNCFGIAYIDISTAEFWVAEFPREKGLEVLEDEICRLGPTECLIPAGSSFASLWRDSFPSRIDTMVNFIEEIPSMEKAQALLTQKLELYSLEAVGLRGFSAGIIAAAMVISFLDNTYKIPLKHIKQIRPYFAGDYMEIDYASFRNLELVATMREGKQAGSLFSVLDYSCTAMGKRNMKKWIERPLIDVEMINQRQEAVAELVNQIDLREAIRSSLASVYDIERLTGRIGSRIATPRDLLALKKSIAGVGTLLVHLKDVQSQILQEINKIDPLLDVYELIDRSIDEEAPISIKEGGIIKKGYNEEIDELIKLSQEGSNWLIDLENREKERTGIRSLKVGYNRVFGYYIEVSKSNLHLVPGDYVRKQTLVNTERFISEELKNYEHKILGARERLFALEYQEFLHIRESLEQHISRLQRMATMVATLDVLQALATAAYLNDYSRPLVQKGTTIEIKAGRHPVVEKALVNSRFIPNDVYLDNNEAQFAIVTGPNMGGKSTFMRQIAVIAIMAQMGSFVPAEVARIGVVDRIFTRVGATDDIYSGQSTFMVEMVELANILNNATSNSLVVLDEIGRGTSTYDGLSIAQAASEYILHHIGAKTLFATHYHELTSLADLHKGVFNLSVSVKETDNTLVFLKKVLPGKADRSYGVHVAALAGVPSAVVNRAQEILATFEPDRKRVDLPNVVQPVLFAENHPILTELGELDVDNLSPREALGLLYRWKEEL